MKKNDDSWIDDAMQEAKAEAEKRDQEASHTAAKLPTREEPFAKEEVYKTEILPILEKAVDLCNKHGIPYMWWAIHTVEDSGPNSIHVGQTLSMRSDHIGARKMSLVGNWIDGTISDKEMVLMLMANALGEMTK